VLLEFAPHVLPALGPSVEIDANLIWECLVDYSGGLLGYGSGHVVRLDEDCSGNWMPLEGEKASGIELYYAFANATMVRTSG
jgi:hypothetical protein